MGHDMGKIRVGTAEREETVQVLGSAMADGRLTMAEYEARVDSVLGSVTRGELAMVTADLPVVQEDRNLEAERDKAEWREYLEEWQWWIGSAIIMTGIWGFQSISEGELTRYWPMWPLGIWGVILVAMIFMPDDKDDEDEKG